MDNKKLALAIAVSALGYFVDVYDIILFTAVRVPSLKSMGLTDELITNVGMQLINIQLIGMLLGGITWGILGDKRGRLSILFGSILLYSSATFANAFVTSVEAYGLLRFIAGFGLAGELGAAITLVNELMSAQKRGYGSMIIVTSGVFGGIAGGLVGNYLSWQTAYILGGLGGFLLFFLRLGMFESGLFQQLKQKPVKRGSLLMFLQSPMLLKKYLKCLTIGVPFWVSVGLFITLAPELGRALNLTGPVTGAVAIVFFNIGLGLGDLSSSLLSQFLGSRRKVVMLYLGFSLMSVILMLSSRDFSPSLFYFFCAMLGFSNGYWVLFITVTSEQFGTNLRATATTSASNFVRGMVIPFSLLLSTLKPNLGIIMSMQIIAVGAIFCAFLCILTLRETFARNLDFVET